MSTILTEGRVQEAFLAAQPYLAASILDLSVQHPNWMADLWDLKEWDRGAGTVLQQLVFRGGRPQIERGFKNWRKLENTSGCQPCEGDNCSYNWTTFGGHAFERKTTTLMDRDFRSPKYCIKEIQTTAMFDEVFAKIVENLYRQISFFKEFNIGQNFLTELAKKFVVDSGGPKCNTQNPYVYRNIGSARLSALNIEMLEFFYESMRRLPDAIPYDVVDGSPVYSIMASHQLFARLYRDDANLRQDVRFSGLANDNLMKYNFMSTIRGMFIVAPILYPRRFIITNGEPVEVLPFVNDVPGEVGAYTYINPAYEASTHEEVIIHGKSPFSLFYMPTETSLAGAATFGPEQSFMQNWQWVNPSTDCDPARREGFFMTSATIGLSQQYSEGIYAILVERPSVALSAMYTPNPVCPVAPPSCNNSVPALDCPCPVVMNIQPNPFIPGNYYFTFGTPVTGEAEDPVIFQLDNGGSVTGELVQISSDGLTAELTFTQELAEGLCSNIVSILCVSALQCSSTVQSVSDCRSGATNTIAVVLTNPIKADAANDLVTAYTGDCTTITLEVVSVDMSTLTWTLRYDNGSPTAEDFNCSTCGISRICVPTATDNTCPACEVTNTPCVNEEEELG